MFCCAWAHIVTRSHTKILTRHLMSKIPTATPFRHSFSGYPWMTTLNLVAQVCWLHSAKVLCNSQISVSTQPGTFGAVSSIYKTFSELKLAMCCRGNFALASGAPGGPFLPSSLLSPGLFLSHILTPFSGCCASSFSSFLNLLSQRSYRYPWWAWPWLLLALAFLEMHGIF